MNKLVVDLLQQKGLGCVRNFLARLRLAIQLIEQWLQWGVTFSQVVWLIGC